MNHQEGFCLTSKLTINVILAIVCAIILAVWPVRRLLTDDFPATDRGGGSKYFLFVIAAFLGALMLVFLSRAIRANRASRSS
jgi:hypothetical protein